MSDTVLSCLTRLRPDAWRTSSGFSGDLEIAHKELFKDGQSESNRIQILNDWLQTEQPCLFGRAAAKLGALSYCVLTASDLRQSDDAIFDKIQECRLQWTREAFEGKKSGFIIWLVSPSVAVAEPSSGMLELATRICTLYLEREIKPDRIYLDEIFLEKPGSLRTTWKWFAGVNFFSSQGDKRWWHDHRIPGGMAFSINSVGHLVKSSIISKAMIELGQTLASPDEGYADLPIDSLERALQVAMHTISLASDAVSGRATELLQLPEDRTTLAVPECPVKLPRPFADKNFCEYKGYYHTDFTIPSEYFLNAVERSAENSGYSLDFTYLFRRSLDNPEFKSMGVGQPIRQVSENEDSLVTDRDGQVSSKELMANETVVSIDDQERLTTALAC